MPWLDLTYLIPLPAAFYFIWRTVGKPPLPRWKTMVLASAVVVSTSLSRVIRTAAPDAWAFLIFAVVMMIVALLVIRPRDENAMR